MVLDLCYGWGRDPRWYYSLPREEQVRILGWWRDRCERATPKESPRAVLSDRVHVAPEAASYWLGEEDP